MKKILLLLLLLAEWSSIGLRAQTDYIVGPQDVLAISVFGEAELSGRYTVEQDGTFTFPQIGRVTAKGITLRELERVLTTRLADGYLKNPQVAVAIENYRSQRILIIGEVRAPGEYQLSGEMTLLAALVRAGATTPTASQEALVVRPPKKGAPSEEPEVIRVDIARLQAGDMSLNITLQDGDTINVPRALSVFVAGQVRQPGAYAVERGTTVLQVLSLAGGMTERGSSGRIRIQRSVKDKKTGKAVKAEVKARLTDFVEPGDTIVVGERFF